MMQRGVGGRLNAVLAEAGLGSLDAPTIAKFEAYATLIVHWNARFNLTSVRTEDAIISRHLAESVACAKALPPGIATLLDFGSGAGLPGIPIALCRPEIAVTLAESKGKKAAFLHEATRVLGITVKVHAGRAEAVGTAFDCVVLRAVDKMPKAVAAAAKLVASAGLLALMTSENELQDLRRAAGSEFLWDIPTQLPFASQRIVALGSRRPISGTI